jgi:hypothetical protein
VTEENTTLEVKTTSPLDQLTRQPDPRRWLMLAFVLCAGFVDVLDNFIINVALLGRPLVSKAESA